MPGPPIYEDWRSQSSPGSQKVDLQSVTGPKFLRTGVDCRYCIAGPPHPCKLAYVRRVHATCEITDLAGDDGAGLREDHRVRGRHQVLPFPQIGMKVQRRPLNRSVVLSIKT